VPTLRRWRYRRRRQARYRPERAHPGQAGFAPAGRHTRFRQVIASLTPPRPALPGRTEDRLHDVSVLRGLPAMVSMGCLRPRWSAQRSKQRRSPRIPVLQYPGSRSSWSSRFNLTVGPRVVDANVHPNGRGRSLRGAARGLLSRGSGVRVPPGAPLLDADLADLPPRALPAWCRFWCRFRAVPPVSRRSQASHARPGKVSCDLGRSSRSPAPPPGPLGAESRGSWGSPDGDCGDRAGTGDPPAQDRGGDGGPRWRAA
jgi:hypothetical protein